MQKLNIHVLAGCADLAKQSFSACSSTGLFALAISALPEKRAGKH